MRREGHAYLELVNTGQMCGIPQDSAIFTVHGTDKRYATRPETRVGNNHAGSSYEICEVNEHNVIGKTVVGKLTLDSGSTASGKISLLTPANMLSKDVKRMIGASDGDMVASGYDHNRNTVSIYFEGEYLVIVTEEIERTEKQLIFSAFWFHNVKRMYRKYFNAELLKLLTTFGNEPPLTD